MDEQQVPAAHTPSTLHGYGASLGGGVPAAPTPSNLHGYGASNGCGMSCSLQATTESIKDYVENLVRSLLTETEERERIPSSRTLPTRIKEIIKGSVRQLKSVNAEGLEEKLGTIVFLKTDFAITCFHEVYHNGLIMESNLQVDGEAVSHVVSFPYYDLSFYKCPGREGQSLQLGSVDSISLCGLIYLASYPDILDSEEESNLVICSGSVCNIEDDTVLGQYQCFPGSSGGAILSSTGRFLGIHTESVYYQDGSVLQPPDWFYDCKPSDAVRTLKWGKVEHAGEGFWEKVDNKKVAIYAAQNAISKGHLGRFLSIGLIRTKLLEEGVLPSRSRGKKRQVDD